MTSLNTSPAVSCVECQRRKQKCNRQFPCNHCSKRGVAHLCRFVSKATKNEATQNDGSSKSSKKRALEGFDDDDWDNGFDNSQERDDFDATDALNALGYMPHTHHLVLGNHSGPKVGKDPMGKDAGSIQSEELKIAMLSMPAKPYTDCLVDNWLNGANHHYYPLYPPEFRTQYDGWWATPPDKTTPELTALILRVCACSALYIMDSSVKERLEMELRADAVTFANRMHTAAEKLSASIPPGKGGLVHVQQLFLGAFWLKSAERWTEAWHALGVVIRAANEIGLHQDSLSEGMSEFDREMRRRVWGVLYTWDFALSAMLSRPLLVNHADCTFVTPTLALENDPEHPDQPSPFRHMNLHAQVCLAMAAELSSVSNKVIPISVTQRVLEVVQHWFDNLPPEYSRKNPDTRWDSEFHWVVFQRRYIHLIGYMCMFDPLKPYVTKNSGKPMSDAEKELREAGVKAALGLMDVSWELFENVASIGAKFHYSVFCIFDTTSVLCSGLVHDEARNFPQRETVLEAIKKGVGMLDEIKSVSKTSADLGRILKNLIANLPLSPREKSLIGVTKRARARISSPKRQELPAPRLQNKFSASSLLIGAHHNSSGSSSSAYESDATSVTSPLGSGGDQFEAHPGDGQQQETFVPQPAGPVYSNFEPGLLNHSSLQHPDWQYHADSVATAGAYHGANMLSFDQNIPSVPTVLQYWDWQGLDIGNEFWDTNPPPPPPPL